MTLNKKRTVVKAKTHKNFEGGDSFDIKDPFTKLQIMATSCFFGEPAFYVEGESKPAQGRSSYGYYGRFVSGYGEPIFSVAEGKNTRQLMEEAIDAALDTDIERTLKFAVELRNEWFMRSTPQVIMVRAAIHKDIEDTGLIGQYAPQIMTRLDEVMNQMAYFESMQGTLKRIPSRLKRAWASRLSQATEYELAKYKMSDRTVNIFDAVNLTHAHSEGIDKLKAGNLSLGSEGIETWESIRSGGGSWKDAAKVMGHMALLRNLRNLHDAGELSEALLTKLINGVENGKQLPFRYFSAYKAIGVRSGRIADVLEECLEDSLKYSIPRFSGRGLSICDVSASMDAKLSGNSEMSFKEIAALMSAITTRAFEGGGDTLLFATSTEYTQPRRKTSILTEVDNIISKGAHLGGGTDIIKAFQEVVRKGEFYDTIFVYSDMQCGYDGNVPNLIKQYRKNVNPNVQVFFVNLAGYQDSLVPEFFEKTYLVGGWTDKMLQFADKIIGITNGRILTEA